MITKLNLILVVDTSASMKGAGIGAVNDAVLNVIQMVEDYAKYEMIDCTIEVITYGDEVSKSDSYPISEYIWNDVKASGVTSFGKACEVLLTKLKSQNKCALNSYEKKLIVLITDGTSTDDYTSRLCHLIESVSFQNADRIAITIGQNCDGEILSAFTSNSKSIIASKDIENIIYIMNDM